MVRVGNDDVRVIVENPNGVTHGVRSIVREGNVMRVTLGAAADAAE